MPSKIYYINSKDLLCEYTVIKQDDLFYYLESDLGLEYIKAKTDCFETPVKAVLNSMQTLLDEYEKLKERGGKILDQLR